MTIGSIVNVLPHYQFREIESAQQTAGEARRAILPEVPTSPYAGVPG
jgi:hypothetical protein